jgi:hypothetical protein
VSGITGAHAAVLGCGQVVTTSTTLTSDVGPCTNNGIIVGADNIVLNLGGHHVFGTPQPGDGAGVLVAGRHGVTVLNGTVTDFDGGVVIANGGNNTVRAVTARDNLGSSGDPIIPDTLYGDGILIEGSSNNTILANRTVNNGPFSGIGLISRSDSDHVFSTAPTTGNIIRANQVTDNVACRQGAHPGCDNDGVRLEPGVGPGNTVIANFVARNGLDGISLFADTDHNSVESNYVTDNGFNGTVPGDGVRIFGSFNLIRANTALDNAAGGVTVGRRPVLPPGSLPPSQTGNPRGKFNTLTANHAAGSNAEDLYDSNPNCDNNVWHANSGTKVAPPCTLG